MNATRAFSLNGSHVSSVLSCEVTAGELALTTFAQDAKGKAAESKPASGGHTFEGLVAAHERMVLRVAYRLLGRLEDAQDAAQEVFLRLFRNQDRIGADPKSWLYRVTVNVCNDHHRRRKSALELVPRSETDPAPDPERALALEERKRLVTEGLATLPERERAAVVLRDIEGLSTAEVAGILGVEEVTVRTQVFSARLKLAKYVRSRQ
ncbi:MAG TPA: sigma-70 family RNA polymerase sigma factor [Bryobacteraceae bacterium]|jgi:RNA polymerase sigma-70 factor (ECF subfamily)